MPKHLQPIMGDLPDVRVNHYRPFLNAGIDFFGPIYIKSGTRKSKTFFKYYGCVFVCMSTKAVHLELVSDLSAEAFLASLRKLKVFFVTMVEIL